MLGVKPLSFIIFDPVSP